MMKITKFALALGLALAWAGQAFAAFTFSNVQITTNSITFTIDGDMSGYVAPSAPYKDQFGIQYIGGLWEGGTYQPNFWSASPFDNKSVNSQGNTGQWGSSWGYTWSMLNGDLSDAFANNRTVTLDFGANYLNPTANGTLNFVWGWANSQGGATVLYSIQTPATDVPEPAPLALLIPCLAALALRGRKRA